MHDSDAAGAGAAHGSDLALLWRTRDSRKGRNSINLPPCRRPSRCKDVAQGVWRMASTFSYWEPAFWIGFGYSVGSAIWVVNSYFFWLPTAFPEGAVPAEGRNGGGITALLGVLCFEAAAMIAYLEAINPRTEAGNELRRLLEERPHAQERFVVAKLRAFVGRMRLGHGRSRDGGLWRGLSISDPDAALTPSTSPCLGSTDTDDDLPCFHWLPSHHGLTTHLIRDIGFLACVVQLFGATIFLCTSIVALPGIDELLSQRQLIAAYWIPQMVASACFLIAGILFTAETQERWHKPEPGVLGWWIGVWSIVGSIGFELYAALGPYDDPTAVYQCGLASLWGSSAYLVSSLLQWHEAVHTNPVERLVDEPGEVKSYGVHPI